MRARWLVLAAVAWSSAAAFVLPRAAPPRAPLRLFAGPNAAASFYEVLGLETSAAASEVKRAYRRKALEFHPDVNDAPEAKEQFVRVTEAYNTLSDTDKRAVYDRKLRMEQAAASGGGGRGRAYASGGRSARAASARAARDPTRNFDAWREANPTADMIDDSFTSIFSDLFSSGGSGVGGFFSDLVDYLEAGVGGASSSEFKDFVRSGPTEEVEAEAKTSANLGKQLSEKLRTVQRAERRAGADLRSHKATMASSSYRFRMEDLDLEADLEERHEGLKQRVRVMEKHLKEARKREEFARAELDRRKYGGAGAGASGAGYRSSAGGGGGYRSTASSSASSRSTSSPPPPPPPRRKDPSRLRQSVEDELKRMKRNMGK